MIEQMQSFHIRYLLDAASKLAGESVVIDSRDGRRRRSIRRVTVTSLDTIEAGPIE
jgi:hypothetical protein